MINFINLLNNIGKRGAVPAGFAHAHAGGDFVGITGELPQAGEQSRNHGELELRANLGISGNAARIVV